MKAAPDLIKTSRGKKHSQHGQNWGRPRPNRDVISLWGEGGKLKNDDKEHMEKLKKNKTGELQIQLLE